MFIFSKGEWECPACDFLNFGRNMTCLNRHGKRPKDKHMQNIVRVIIVLMLRVTFNSLSI